MGNSDLKDNQMQRGLNQALYKYLPHAWIDFYKKVDRTPYTAYVSHWNSEEISEKEINKNRLLLNIQNVVNNFKANGGEVKDFLPDINESTYSVRTLSPGKNVDIISEISPLTFFCGKCSKVHSYSTSDDLLRLNNRLKCKDHNCQGVLKQLNLVYACECGWGGPIKSIPCRNHGFEHLYYRGDFTFRCSKEPSLKIEIRTKCPSCDKLLFTKNALDMSNYLPKSLTMIDLVDRDLDKFLEQEIDGSKIIMGEWLGKISEDDLAKIVKSKLNKENALEMESKKAVLVESIMNEMGITEEMAIKFAEISIKKLGADDINELANTVVDEINLLIRGFSNNSVKDLAIQLLEYKTVVGSNESYKSTLDDAIEISKKLNTTARPEEYKDISRKFGFNSVQASGEIPFIMCSYGYTRKESDPGRATLMGFPVERSKKNVYASKLQTEGVLFEIDRAAIVKWLLKNKIISDLQAPNVEDEVELKMWFINNVNSNAIPTFTKINKETDTITYYVYNLIHSISHALLKQSANLCGLDKNSLSEYIFPNIPAVLIYCQNSQGLNIGAMFTIFEASFGSWLNSTKDSIEKCIFDPRCIDNDCACSGCLFLNEVSCIHFNKDLNRRMLLGYYDKNSGERFFGFWEEV